MQLPLYVPNSILLSRSCRENSHYIKINKIMCNRCIITLLILSNVLQASLVSSEKPVSRSLLKSQIVNINVSVMN